MAYLDMLDYPKNGGGRQWQRQLIVATLTHTRSIAVQSTEQKTCSMATACVTGADKSAIAYSPMMGEGAFFVIKSVFVRFTSNIGENNAISYTKTPR